MMWTGLPRVRLTVVGGCGDCVELRGCGGGGRLEVRSALTALDGARRVGDHVIRLYALNPVCAPRVP